MRKHLMLLGMVGLLVVSTGCYHATIETGAGAPVVGYEAHSPESLNAAMIEATRRAVADRQPVYLQGR